MEAALATHFGTPVPIRLVVDDEAADERVFGPVRPEPGASNAGTDSSADPRRAATERPPGAVSEPSATTVEPEGDDTPDLLDPDVLAAETEPAGAGLTPEERLKQAFPGAEEVYGCTPARSSLWWTSSDVSPASAPSPRSAWPSTS